MALKSLISDFTSCYSKFTPHDAMWIYFVNMFVTCLLVFYLQSSLFYQSTLCSLTYSLAYVIRYISPAAKHTLTSIILCINIFSHSTINQWEDFDRNPLVDQVTRISYLVASIVQPWPSKLSHQACVYYLFDLQYQNPNSLFLSLYIPSSSS